MTPLRSWTPEFSNTFDRLRLRIMAKFAPLRSFQRQIINYVQCNKYDDFMDQSQLHEVGICNPKRLFMYESEVCSVTGQSLISIRNQRRDCPKNEFEEDRG